MAAFSRAVEMQAAVVETALPAVRAGQTATVRVAGYDAPLVGTVRLVAPGIDPATRMGRVRIELPAGAVLPGGSATARDCSSRRRSSAAR